MGKSILDIFSWQMKSGLRASTQSLQHWSICFLCSLISKCFLQKDSKYEVMTPRIDSVLDRFRQRGPLSSETDVGEERRTEEPPMVWLPSFVYLQNLFTEMYFITFGMYACCTSWVQILTERHLTDI